MNCASECIPTALFVHFSAHFGEVFATMVYDDGVFRRLHTPDVARIFSGWARAHRFRGQAAMKSPYGLRRDA